MTRDRITLAVLELSEKEVIQQLVNVWWYDKGECGNDRTSKKVIHVIHFRPSVVPCGLRGAVFLL